MEQRPSTLFDPYADAPLGEAFLSAAGNLAVLGHEALRPVPGRRYTSPGHALAIDRYAVRAGTWPHPIWRVVRVLGREAADPRDPAAIHDCCGSLVVAEALPAWLVFGPHGARVARFLDRLGDLDPAVVEAVGADARYRPFPALPDAPDPRVAEAETHAADEVRHVLAALADAHRPGAGRSGWPDGAFRLVDARWLAFERLASDAARLLVRGETGTSVWHGPLPPVAVAH